MHGIDQTKALGHAAAVNEFLDLRRDVDESASSRHFEPKMFSERFQCRSKEYLFLRKAATADRVVAARSPQGEKRLLWFSWVPDFLILIK